MLQYYLLKITRRLTLLQPNRHPPSNTEREKKHFAILLLLRYIHPHILSIGWTEDMGKDSSNLQDNSKVEGKVRSSILTRHPKFFSPASAKLILQLLYLQSEYIESVWVE